MITQPDAPGLIFKNKISEDYVFRGLCMAFGKEDGKIIKVDGNNKCGVILTGR